MTNPPLRWITLLALAGLLAAGTGLAAAGNLGLSIDELRPRYNALAEEQGLPERLGMRSADCREGPRRVCRYEIDQSLSVRVEAGHDGTRVESFRLVYGGDGPTSLQEAGVICTLFMRLFDPGSDDRENLLIVKGLLQDLADRQRAARDGKAARYLLIRSGQGGFTFTIERKTS